MGPAIVTLGRDAIIATTASKKDDLHSELGMPGHNHGGTCIQQAVTRGPQRPGCDAAFRRVHRSARQEPDRFHATPAGVRHDTLARLARHRLGNCNWPRLVCPASSSGPAWSKVAWTMLQCRTPCCNERLAPRPGFHFRAAGSSGYSHGDGPCHQQRVRRKHPRSSLCSMQHAACSMQHAACSMQHAACSMQHAMMTTSRSHQLHARAAFG
jgi:hypothetical protein